MTQNKTLTDEAFEKWMNSYPEGADFSISAIMDGDGRDALLGWQAAKRETAEEIVELKADNERLREALTFYAERKHIELDYVTGDVYEYEAGDIAKQALASTPTQSLAEHDNEVLAPHKKAIEFAEYMAKCIEQFMVTVNELDIADEQEDETMVDILQERRGEYWRAVNTSVYEFRKRADVALKA